MKLSEANSIIVTSGTGFVGSYLVEKLLEFDGLSIVDIVKLFPEDVMISLETPKDDYIGLSSDIHNLKIADGIIDKL